jgi:hypothetical protein
VNDQGKPGPRGLVGFWRDKNGETLSTSVSDKTLDELEQYVCKMRELPQDQRGRLAIWGNKSENPQAPSHRLMVLPPRERKPADDY